MDGLWLVFREVPWAGSGGAVQVRIVWAASLFYEKLWCFSSPLPVLCCPCPRVCRTELGVLAWSWSWEWLLGFCAGLLFRMKAPGLVCPYFLDDE